MISHHTYYMHVITIEACEDTCINVYIFRRTCIYLLDLVYYNIPNMLENMVSLYDTQGQTQTLFSLPVHSD